jgi:hypothetical protein
MGQGARTRSTRSGSGGRSIFHLPADSELRWLSFRIRFEDGTTSTALELRAQASNLQDTIPGLVYKCKDGQLCTQYYAGERRIQDRCQLPGPFAEHWRRMSVDEDYFRTQVELFINAIATAGYPIDASYSARCFGSGGSQLRFYHHGCSPTYNSRNTVESVLARHQYTFHEGMGRWTHSNATGSPGIRPIPEKEGLWRSDHAGDPLHGVFDAWDAHVVLDHLGDLDGAVYSELFGDDGCSEDEEGSDEGEIAHIPDRVSEPIVPVDIFAKAEVPEFDLSPFPIAIRSYAKERALAAGHDPAAYAFAMLSACSAMIDDGSSIRIRAKSGYFQPPMFWFLMVGPSSSAKTPALDAAYRPVKALQLELTKQHLSEVARWEARQSKDEQDIGPKPMRTSYLVNDATVEGLRDLLAGQNRGVTAVYAEIDQWLGAHDCYKGGRSSKDRGDWLAAYDGGPHSVDRAGGRHIAVPNWSIGVCGATTFAALARLEKSLPPDGLFQRFILLRVRPARAWSDTGTVDSLDELRSRYEELIKRLADEAPVNVVMSGRAELLMERFQKEALQLAEGFENDMPDLAAHAGKLVGMVGRLSLVIYCIEAGALQMCDPVGPDIVERAISICRQAFRHAISIFETLRGTEVHALPKLLARSILASQLEGKVTRSKLTQCCSAFRDAGDVEKLACLNFLVDAGWLLPDNKGRTYRGGVTSYLVNPEVHSQFAKYGDEQRELRKRTLQVIKDGGG